MKPKDKSISVIVCVNNFAESVDSFCRSLQDTLDGMKRSYQVVFVDDGSTDGTFEKLAATAKKTGFKILKMRAVFGESAALAAGLRYSQGDIVVFISGRVRVNTRGIPGLLEPLSEGKDMVVGWRTPRRDPLLNRWISRAFNRMACRLSSVRLHDINSGVFATHRAVLERISFYGNLYNFIPVLASRQGYRVAEKPIEQLSGSFRRSRYPKEYLQRLLDMVTVFFLSRYSKKPIHFLGFMGTLFVLSGIVIEVYLFVYRILRIGGIAGRPLLVLGALFLVIGIQMISIGLLGEMLIFTHAGDIEEYNIEEVIES